MASSDSAAAGTADCHGYDSSSSRVRFARRLRRVRESGVARIYGIFFGTTADGPSVRRRRCSGSASSSPGRNWRLKPGARASPSRSARLSQNEFRRATRFILFRLLFASTGSRIPDVWLPQALAQLPFLQSFRTEFARFRNTPHFLLLILN